MNRPPDAFPRLPRSWWLKHRYFKAYMLREATVLPLIFFLLCLMGGLWALYRGEETWAAWLVFMRSPLVVALNLLALAASLYHAATFFVLFPRVMPLRLGRRAIAPQAIVAGQWVGVVIIGLLFFWLFGRT